MSTPRWRRPTGANSRSSAPSFARSRDERPVRRSAFCTHRCRGAQRPRPGTRYLLGLRADKTYGQRDEADEREPDCRDRHGQEGQEPKSFQPTREKGLCLSQTPREHWRSASYRVNARSSSPPEGQWRATRLGSRYRHQSQRDKRISCCEKHHHPSIREQTSAGRSQLDSSKSQPPSSCSRTTMRPISFPPSLATQVD